MTGKIHQVENLNYHFFSNEVHSTWLFLVATYPAWCNRMCLHIRHNSILLDDHLYAEIFLSFSCGRRLQRRSARSIITSHISSHGLQSAYQKLPSPHLFFFLQADVQTLDASWIDFFLFSLFFFLRPMLLIVSLLFSCSFYRRKQTNEQQTNMKTLTITMEIVTTNKRQKKKRIL